MLVDIDRVKIFVTIPVEDVEILRNAVCDAGAGVIGNYTHCTTSVHSVGTFKPVDGANPHIGEVGTLEYVNEEKLEFVCNVSNVKNIVSRIREVHPYEEPAIDIVPLLDESSFSE